MDIKVRELIESLHASERMASLAIAGAGTQAVGWILGVAGASRTVLDVQIPYASSAVTDYIGFEPEQFVSAETARSLARAALLPGGRSAERRLSGGGRGVYGHDSHGQVEERGASLSCRGVSCDGILGLPR